jgi:hypothetical protein
MGKAREIRKNLREWNKQYSSYYEVQGEEEKKKENEMRRERRKTRATVVSNAGFLFFSLKHDRAL